jgi:hypothetical protein
LFFEMASHSVAQAELQLMSSRDPIASTSQVMGIIGTHHHSGLYSTFRIYWNKYFSSKGTF